MPRKDTPCAGGCGALLWSGPGSRPEGERTCRPCRTAGKGPKNTRTFHETPCEVCGKAVKYRTIRPRTCGITCRDAVNGVERRPDACRCGRRLPRGRFRCELCKTERRRARWRRKNAVRRGAGQLGPTISIVQLGDRDGWRCHLCRRHVSRALAFPHRMCPTFDHLIPVSAGGSDDPSNLKLAHLTCNSSRGANGTVQLMLIG